MLNTTTGQAQEVLHVDNTAAGGGDGSAETPFNNLAAAQAASSAQGIIYVHVGDGTTANQNAGITLNKAGQQLIGSGINFVYDGTRFATANGAEPLATLLIPASSAPAITNVNALGDGITVAANNVKIAGIAVDGAARDGIAVTGNDVSIESIQTENNLRHGIYGLNITGLSLSSLVADNNGEDGVRLEAAGAGNSLTGAVLSNITASSNKNGVRFYANTDASLTGMMTSSTVTGNTQHGIVVYDDSTAGNVTADLGGGSLNSAGLNILAGNTLEDLALDTDGAALSAMNNWWGQAGGPLITQMYYGAVVDDGLIGHWTLDDAAGGTARDRSVSGNNGTLINGPAWGAGQVGGALSFDGNAINDSVSLGSPAVLTNISNEVTVSGWLNVNVFGSYNYIFSNDRDCCGLYKGFSVRAVSVLGRAEFIIWDNAGGRHTVSTANGAVPLATWTFVSATFNGTAMKIYINGVLSNTTPYVGTIGTPPSFNAYLGALASHSGTLGLNGALDDVRVYNRPLGDSEISELYRMNATSTVNTSGFLAVAP